LAIIHHKASLYAASPKSHRVVYATTRATMAESADEVGDLAQRTSFLRVKTADRVMDHP